MDPQAIEARTHTLGRELFAAATRAHARLSILNRWTTQVLSWCLSDPQVKSSVLRFIDVLPCLQTPREIARHVREYFPSGVKLPPALRAGSQLARPGLLTHGALAAVVRQLVEQVARQFIAEHRPEGAVEVTRSLAAGGCLCSLDLLGEQVLSHAEADRYAAQCRTLLEEGAGHLSVKPSALSPRFDPISPASSIADAARRLLPILQAAAARGALVTLDMEQYELRDLTLALTRHILQPPQREPGAVLGIVIQAYLRDAEAVVDELLRWLEAHDRPLAIRLVKGAYWDAELAQAVQQGWPAPVYADKAQTDLVFECLTRRLLAAHPRVTTAIASHNVRSIAHAMAAAEALGLTKDQLEFQLLYGMGEALQEAVVSMGYRVRVYTPIGELIPGMAYLVRRILENTANESFLRQDWSQERSTEEFLAPPMPGQEPGPRAADVASPGWAREPLADFAKADMRDRMARALETVVRQLGRTYPLQIGAAVVETGRWATSGNPARTDEAVGRVAQAGAAEVQRAVEAARASEPAWAALPVEERVTVLRRAADLMRCARWELAAWEVLEVGKTWREADVDVVEAVEYLEYYSAGMRELSRGKPLLQLPGERNRYLYVPRGVAAVIAPWNFPLAIPTGMTVAALAAGNPVILKPAGPSSVIAALLIQLLRQAGVPPGAAQYLPGPGAEVGTALIRHPEVATILFTGSKAVGLSILEACGTAAPGQRMLKRVIAEMGGKNAVIVDADADLDAAVAGILRSAFGYGGQKCSAASRVIVDAQVADRLIHRLAEAADRLVLGDPADPGADLGPLIDAAARQRLQEAAARAARVGRIAYRYPEVRVPAGGFFVGPVIVTDVPPKDPLAQDELFGPLVCVLRARTFDEALALANDTDYALTGGLYSRSPARIEQTIRAFDVGNLYINRPITGAMVGRQPFGGHRMSGLGTKAGGPDYLLQLLLPKTVCMNTTRHGIPLE